MNKAMWNARLNAGKTKLERARRYLALNNSEHRQLRVEKLANEVTLLNSIVAVIKTATKEVQEVAGANASLDVLWWKRRYKALVGEIKSANKHLIKYPHLAGKTTRKLASLESGEKTASRMLLILDNAEKRIKVLRGSK